ncbi:acetyl-CoA carboxylase biotin carboxyl carrier protein [Myxosarcina sp. GI1]|uniref:acetyl-CoA carboxylase biotin carboxyl carrier protein n=1 Tax=Myxosarcina sp. GI1 TaxID=1541065 RepID=UPI000562187C|nr:acetyl-CoA carboxylase biotin carboxyl carrier protein [Myxosarcina sp. GI1]
MSINFQELRELLGAIAKTDITELTLKSDEFELTVRQETNVVTTKVIPEVVDRSIESASDIERTAGSDTTATKDKDKDKQSWIEITSPMVGTFYRAPAPDEEPYVEVGDRINSGDTVCIIEAMKLMNEIEGEVAGKVVEIAVENGEPVEFGQVLMRIDPS